MAKKSMIIKQQRKQKFAVREYTRCERCGRPHSVLRKFKLCRICFRVNIHVVSVVVVHTLSYANSNYAVFASVN